jgi:hypothetical protein
MYAHNQFSERIEREIKTYSPLVMDEFKHIRNLQSRVSLRREGLVDLDDALSAVITINRFVSKFIPEIERSPTDYKGLLRPRSGELSEIKDHSGPQTINRQEDKREEVQDPPVRPDGILPSRYLLQFD